MFSSHNLPATETRIRAVPNTPKSHEKLASRAPLDAFGRRALAGYRRSFILTLFIILPLPLAHFLLHIIVKPRVEIIANNL